MKKNSIKVRDLSRFLIYILGHNPHEFGLVPDSQGFFSFKELLQAMHEDSAWSYVRQSNINEVLVSDARHLFETSDNSIRTLSRNWELDLDTPADIVPALLYIPIRRKAHCHIIEKGLLNRDNKFYVLTPDKSMAERIGRRKDQKPVLIEVMAARAKDEGKLFFSFGGLFLSMELSPRYIAGPLVPKSIIKAKESKPVKKKDPVADFSAGTFTLDSSRDPDAYRNKSRLKKGKKKKGWKEEIRGMRRRG